MARRLAAVSKVKQVFTSGISRIGVVLVRLAFLISCLKGPILYLSLGNKALGLSSYGSHSFGGLCEKPGFFALDRNAASWEENSLVF